MDNRQHFDYIVLHLILFHLVLFKMNLKQKSNEIRSLDISVHVHICAHEAFA